MRSILTVCNSKKQTYWLRQYSETNGILDELSSQKKCYLCDLAQNRINISIPQLQGANIPRLLVRNLSCCRAIYIAKLLNLHFEKQREKFFSKSDNLTPLTVTINHKHSD